MVLMVLSEGKRCAVPLAVNGTEPGEIAAEDVKLGAECLWSNKRRARKAMRTTDPVSGVRSVWNISN